MLLTEAKKKAAKKKESKPKVEANGMEQEIDPNTGQPMEVTKPQKAMTGNPANPVIVYPNMGGMTSVVDPRNPMRNSQTQMLPSDTQHSGRVLSEYIDYALGKIVDPTIPAQGDRDTVNQHQNQTGNIGMDNTDSDKDTAPGGPAEMGDANQRVRRRAGKRNEYNDGMPGVWGGDDADYAEGYVTEDVDKIENAVFRMGRRAVLEPHNNIIRHKPGELIHMKDGTKWFHASDGSQPVKIDDTNRHDLQIYEDTKA